jgi:hypothetical protein
VISIRLATKEVAELKAGRIPKSLLDKIDAQELKASVRSGEAKALPVQEAIAAFREVLGNRLVAPLPNQYGQAGVLLRNLGLSRGQCVSIAKTASAEWRSGPIRVLSLLRQADVLLAGAQQTIPGTAGGPLGLED